MILKEYQKRVVATVGDFLERLSRWRREDEAARKQNPVWGLDWVERALSETASPGIPTSHAGPGLIPYRRSARRSRPGERRRCWSRGCRPYNT